MKYTVFIKTKGKKRFRPKCRYGAYTVRSLADAIIFESLDACEAHYRFCRFLFRGSEFQIRYKEADGRYFKPLSGH